MQLKSAINRLIHRKLQHSVLTYSRAKSIIGCGIIALVAVPIFALVYYYLHDLIGAIAILFTGIIIALALILLKIMGSIRIARELITTSVYLVLLWLTYSQGGILSPAGYWLILIPVISVFLGGVHVGIYWAIISAATITTLFALQAHHISLPNTPISDVLLLQVVSICGLLVIIYTLIYFFELGKTQGFEQLEETLKQSQQKSDALMIANQELHALSFKINAILTAAADGIITTDMNGRITTSNRAINSIFGYRNGEIHGKNINILIAKKTSQHENLLFHDAKENYTLFEITGRRKNGSLFPLEISISKTPHGQENLNIYVMRDITEQKESEQRLAYLAHYDQLTGLPNRLLYEILLNACMTKAKSNNSHVVLLYLDLDNFKNVNNTLGHDIGDIFLNEAAKRFKKCVRENDVICRLGGDEFIFILDDIRDIKDSAIVAKKIISVLKKPIQIKEYEVISGSSIGIAVFPDNGIDAITLTKHADIAMYQAKANGRNNYQYFDEKLNNHVLSQIILENQLQNALRNNEFFIVYQPQYETITHDIVGIEALIRWKNPALGLIKPDDFIPCAEKIGIITTIGEWVLKEACNQFKKWQNADLINPGTKIAINLSIIQMKQANFLQKVTGILEEVAINPKCVELELTESMIMDDPRSALQILQKLVRLGIQIAIDDFGTGYSSLSRLKNFPVHILKIDKSFLYDLAHNKSNASIIQSIISLAHGLGLKVVAEGVETTEQFAFLKENYCDYIQGFYFNPPLDVDTITQLLMRTSSLVE